MVRESEQLATRRRQLGERLAAFRLAARLTQAELASRTFRDRSTLAHIERGRARADEQFWQAADDACLAGGQLLALYQELEQVRRVEQHDKQLSARAAMRAAVPVAPSDSVAFDRSEAFSLIGLLGADEAIDTFETFTRSVIERYELEGPQRLAPEVQMLRQAERDFAPRSISAAQRKRLTHLGARQAALLSYMSANLSRFAESARYSFEGSLLATALNDHELLAWLKGTQSYAAYYQQNYREALTLATAGLTYAGESKQRIRLLSNGVARAAAKLGERATALRAIGEALEAVGDRDAASVMTPCIDLAPYGWARTAANVATAHVTLGNYQTALQLTGELKSTATDSDWSQSLIALDEATALTLGKQADPKQAASVGIAALASSADKPITSVRARGGELVVNLRRFGHRASDDLVAALREYQREPKAIT